MVSQTSPDNQRVRNKKSERERKVEGLLSHIKELSFYHNILRNVNTRGTFLNFHLKNRNEETGSEDQDHRQGIRGGVIAQTQLEIGTANCNSAGGWTDFRAS